MTTFLPIPDELQFLIEKREAADRRRSAASADADRQAPPEGLERRAGQDRRQEPPESRAAR